MIVLAGSIGAVQTLKGHTTVFSNNTPVAVRGLNILKKPVYACILVYIVPGKIVCPFNSITLTAEFGACNTTYVEFWTRSGMSSSMKST